MSLLNRYRDLEEITCKPVYSIIRVLHAFEKKIRMIICLLPSQFQIFNASFYSRPTEHSMIKNIKIKESYHIYARSWPNLSVVNNHWPILSVEKNSRNFMALRRNLKFEYTTQIPKWFYLPE
jgi:hypothetical protein